MWTMLIVAAAAGAAQVADAKGAVAADTVTAAAPGSAAGSTPVATKPKRYCIDATYTGSRMPKRSCKTRDEWMKEGIDPLAAR
jgi:hypothetical protein